MCNMSYKYKHVCRVEQKCSHKKTQENTEVTHEAIQKYVPIYTSSIMSTYAIYTTSPTVKLYTSAITNITNTITTTISNLLLYSI
jgi:hypothetical protein